MMKKKMNANRSIVQLTTRYDISLRSLFLSPLISFLNFYYMKASFIRSDFFCTKSLTYFRVCISVFFLSINNKLEHDAFQNKNITILKDKYGGTSVIFHRSNTVKFS